jgi:16S rRNA (guanine527-N7)-methyltransferase
VPDTAGILSQEASRLGVQLSGDQLKRLGSFVRLLETWNRRVNLVGDRDPEILARKHVPDCMALSPVMPEAGPVVDVGSGAGLPGIVLGCLRPDLEIWLVEPRRKRASFLSEAKAQLGLASVAILEGRAEEAASRPELGHKATALTARALSLEVLLPLADELLAPGGKVLVMQSGALSDSAAADLAKRFGMELDTDATRDYRLAGGEARRILTFRRRP